jgi:Fuc2NAc and GlcNAc transferase
LAGRHGLLDVPNARSSHAIPTPRGGGLAIATVVLAADAYLLLNHQLASLRATVALLAGGLAVAIVGLMDDRRGVSARSRFVVHGVACAAVVSALPELPFQPIGRHAIDLGWPGTLLSLVGCAWFLNLFNFMDGIDGIAAAEAAFLAAAAAVLLQWAGAPVAAVAVFVAVSASSLGFLAWNWSPARIFMGDVGSGFLGFVLAGLALWSTVSFGIPVWTWLILGSLFIADASVTLVRRMLRGDDWTSAHRSHAYQRLSRRWASHSRVTALVLALDVLVLFPLALLSSVRPQWSFALATGTLACCCAGAIWLGAGTTDDRGG